MELCRYLRFLSGPDVFPPAVVLAQLPKLILNAIPVPSEYDCSHEPKNHRASGTTQLGLLPVKSTQLFCAFLLKKLKTKMISVVLFPHIRGAETSASVVA